MWSIPTGRSKWVVDLEQPLAFARYMYALSVHAVSCTNLTSKFERRMYIPDPDRVLIRYWLSSQNLNNYNPVTVYTAKISNCSI